MMWTDDEIDDLMIPVGHAEYAAVAYAEAVAIGRQMRDEAKRAIDDLKQKLAAAHTELHDLRIKARRRRTGEPQRRRR